MSPHRVSPDRSHLSRGRFKKVNIGSFRNNPIVKVLVGPEENEFLLHKDKLCSVSPFFKAAFTGGFRERYEGVVRLPEDDAEIFDLFIQWLYTRNIPIEDPPLAILLSEPKAYEEFPEEEWPCDDGPCEIFTVERPPELVLLEEDGDSPWIPLAELFVLAERLQVRRLKNDIIDRAIDLCGFLGRKNLRLAEAVEIAYDDLPEGSIMRKLLADLVKGSLRESGEKCMSEEEWEILMCCPEFAADVLSDGDTFGSWEIGRSKCVYHEHSKAGAIGRHMECEALEDD